MAQSQWMFIIIYPKGLKQVFVVDGGFLPVLVPYGLEDR